MNGTGMDQLSAHLDRGWELIGRNDPRGAEESARRALEIDPHSPEAYNLLGYSAALEGNAEEAIEAYKQAIALDDRFFEAFLHAAEVCLHPLMDFNEAIRLCDQALELAESDEELIDALLLKFDAVLGQDGEDMRRAKELLKRLPKGPYINPIHSFLIGRAYFEIGEIAKAGPLLESSVQSETPHPDAWYYLGLVHEDRGEAKAAIKAFMKVRELDLGYAPPPWAPTTDQLQEIAQRVVRELDPVLGPYVRQAEIYAGEVPGFELVADGVDPRALLLFDGLYPPEAPHVPCTKIFVYGRNLERASGNLEGLEDQLRRALEREIAVTFLDSEVHDKPSRDLN